MIHTSAIFAYRNPIFTNGKVVLVRQLDPAFSIKVNKRCDMYPLKIFIVRHCIMGRIQKDLCNMKVRKKAFHSEKVEQKSMGIMLGSRIEQWKNGQVTFGIRSNKHVKIIPMMIPKTINDVPCRAGYGIRVRIIFT